MTYEINSKPINSFPVNGYETVSSSIIGMGAGSLIDIYQTVTSIALSQSIIDFNQVVQFQAVADGEGLINFNQTTIATASGSIIGINQSVVSQNVYVFYTRNGWYPAIRVNNMYVAENRIKDFSVTATESDSKQAAVTLKLFPGTYNLDDYVGAPITIDILTPYDSNRIFKGVVNLPELDLITWNLELSCSDLRRDLINNNYANVVPYIGYYSKDLFGDGTGSAADQLDNRLSTVPQTVDFDGGNNLMISDLLPKANADFVYGSSDIHRDDARNVRYEKSIRSRITNTVNITFTYQYQRSYQKLGAFRLSQGHGGGCDFLNNAYSMCRRDMIEQAVAGVGWTVIGNISYTPILPSGVYRCRSPLSPALGPQPILWSTVQYFGQTSPVRDAAGNPVTDSSGNAVTQTALTGAVDTGKLLCFAAGWNAALRFTQNITEKYTLTVRAAQSVAKFGVVSTSESASVTSEYNDAAWENFPEWKGPPPGAIPSNSLSFYIDNDTNIVSYYTAMNAILNRAKTTILKGHRSDKVTFATRLQPSINMSHTVRLNTDRIICIGKVTQYTHTCNVTTGESYTTVQLSLSRSEGLSSETPLTIPQRPSYPPDLSTVNIQMGSTYGVQPRENQTGYVGNKGQGALKTNITESFTVTTPPIPDSIRSNANLFGGATYDIAVPNNLLQLIVKV